MGNHEWCEGCHENDFHRGRPCNPAKKAKVDAEKKEQARRKKIGVEKLKMLDGILKKLGLVPRYGSFLNEGEYPCIKVMYYDAVDWEPR